MKVNKRDRGIYMFNNGMELKGKNNEIYTIQGFIKNGGFGYVYKAQRKSDNKIFAVKEFQNTINDNNKFSFMNEIEMAQTIISPHTIKYEFVNDGKLFSDLPFYIIMEYAENGSLNDEIEKRKDKNAFFNENELLRMFLELAYGMKDINKRIVHRDIKPDNILITNQGIKITDFGLSKYIDEATRYLTFKGYGTEKYCSPEVWKKEKNTILMDIYSMGIVFYELASLNYPYEITNNNYSEAHLYKNIQPISKWNISIPVGISLMITRMLEKTKSKRFQSWDEIIDYLENIKQDDTSINNMAEKAVNAQINYIMAQQKRDATKEIIESKKYEIEKIVNLQYENEIMEPLNSYINNFNLGYYKMSFDKCEFGDGGFGGIINLPNGKDILIQIDSPIDSEIGRPEGEKAGIKIYWQNVILPTFMSREVYAWGSISLDSPMHMGFNILLLKDNDDSYGEWFIAYNDKKYNKPICLELKVLRKELLYTNTTAFSKIEKYNIDILTDFINTCIA